MRAKIQLELIILTLLEPMLAHRNTKIKPYNVFPHTAAAGIAPGTKFYSGVKGYELSKPQALKTR